MLWTGHLTSMDLSVLICKRRLGLVVSNFCPSPETLTPLYFCWVLLIASGLHVYNIFMEVSPKGFEGVPKEVELC